MKLKSLRPDSLMDFAEHLQDCLNKAGKEELGIPVIFPFFADWMPKLMKWSLIGPPVDGRQIWFCVENAEEIRNSLAKELRGRILPIHPSRIHMILKRGPFDALLLPTHGFLYSDPNVFLSTFWKERGDYKACPDFQHPDLILWFWTSKKKPLKLFGIDHHHAVLWDAKQILRPLGVKLDFVWLCDGRPPVNEAIPCQIPSFSSSYDIYKGTTPLSDETKNFLLEKSYDGVLTSHSLVTCHRFKDLSLPMIHINSTRFGNEWIQDPNKHASLVESIQCLLQQNRLQIVHNNRGDLAYFHQYIPTVSPNQELYIPSLCESLSRIRLHVPLPKKILLWDTRQVLLQPSVSPFMKSLYASLKQVHGDAVESQAILMANEQSYLGEGYLDAYAAVIHIPYNISTMSMFQQVRANIPIWVPSKRLLAKLWADSREPNELSWTVFAPGSELNASTMDNVRRHDVIQRWLDLADFYNPDILPLVFQFDSLEELVEKVMATDYQEAMDKAEALQEEKRERIVFAWEQVLGGLNAKASKN